MSAYGSIVADISQLYGGDLDETADGDILIASGKALTVQRIVRRLLTNPTTAAGSSYPWEPTYGAGLAADIGSPLDQRGVVGTVLAQMAQEATVVQSPPPVVVIDASLAAQNTYTITVTYTDSSGTTQTFNFDYQP